MALYLIIGDENPFSNWLCVVFNGYVFVIYITTKLTIHMMLYNTIVHCNMDQERSKNQHQMSITKLYLVVPLTVYQIKRRKRIFIISKSVFAFSRFDHFCPFQHKIHTVL